jgi:hypothetical protein
MIERFFYAYPKRVFLTKISSKKISNSSNDTKFKIAQVVDILFQNWFLVDPTFILLESNKEEGDVKPLLKAQVTRTIKVIKAHFRHTPIDINEEMEDVKEIGGTSAQPETSKQLEISPMLLPTLRSWNLG